ncbi:hypothetical protein [Eubacterium limosum]|uniref:hypothetical protein n=1 Tax=Eubacterium limosum TaxID=1736 RepID=UPI0022E5BC34|nr:hypothetical protein [Eubacterium limosum]
MKKKALGIILMIIVLTLCGCQAKESDEEKILGKWYKDDRDQIEFFEDGTCDVTDLTNAYGMSKYSFLDDNRIKFELYLGNIKVYQYSLEDGVLTFKFETDGVVTEWSRY